MSAGHTRLLFNIGSSGNIFPGTVKYEHNSEESDGNKNFFQTEQEQRLQRWKQVRSNKEASIVVTHTHTHTHTHTRERVVTKETDIRPCGTL